MKAFDYKLGMLFGSWDPLHAGHIRIITKAQALCEDIIIIADTDDYIRKTKKREPYFPIQERAWDLFAIKGVDCVEYEDDIFTKRYWVKVFKPDVLIKGDDWKGKHWSGEGL
ncbi:MAG: adenylyltransferase/cytidyltransferase family protein, partial [Gammaproteobacteria bacterium]|nr:adenylyltransferase/cytidyltransferase family protein [Gammaproteobacteria bacterium]